MLTTGSVKSKGENVNGGKEELGLDFGESMINVCGVPNKNAKLNT